MKHSKLYSILMALCLCFCLTACQEEEKDNTPTTTPDPIPEEGLYFQAQIGNMIWEGDDIVEMYVKTEPEGYQYKMLDFTVCTHDQSSMQTTVIDKWLYLHVKVNEDGSFSNYAVKFAKNKTTTNPQQFEQYLLSNSGRLIVTERTETTISAKYVGNLIDINDPTNEYPTSIIFQDFPLSQAKSIE